MWCEIKEKCIFEYKITIVQKDKEVKVFCIDEEILLDTKADFIIFKQMMRSFLSGSFSRGIIYGHENKLDERSVEISPFINVHNVQKLCFQMLQKDGIKYMSIISNFDQYLFDKCQLELLLHLIENMLKDYSSYKPKEEPTWISTDQHGYYDYHILPFHQNLFEVYG